MGKVPTKASDNISCKARPEKSKSNSLKDKIKYLNRFGYKSLNNELLNEIRKKDYELYKNLVQSINNSERHGETPMLVIFFRNTFSIYTSKHLEKDIKEIIEGTQRFLQDLEVKSNETDFLLLE